ncbi:hypothetical protein BGZ82_011364 [Podila clonocystis]|nr:hypothetical protein BGZ82_011364 [Podila clonocystis]
MASKQSSNRSRTHLHSDQLMDPAGWLRAFLKTLTLATQQEPMLLEANREVARNVTRAKGCSNLSKPQQTAPGIRHCSQGAGETNRSTPAIHHPPAHQHQQPQRPNAASSSGILSSITSRSQGQSSTPSNTDTQPNNTKSNDTTLSRDGKDPEPSPPSSSVSSFDSATNTSSTSNTYQPHSSAAKHSPANHDTVRSEIASIDLSSTLLFSTNQVLQERLMQTTAFLQRTFSPTYRVGSLYIESWTNGTQKRGLDRLKTSVERGDAFMLMRNTAVQLKSLVIRSLDASRSRAMEIERVKSAGTGQRPSGKHGANKEKGESGSNSGEGR